MDEIDFERFFILIPPMWEMFERLSTEEDVWCFYWPSNRPYWFDPEEGVINE